MKKILLISLFIFPFLLFSQSAIIIAHNCINLSDIPDQWIIKAKDSLFIGYGHTSHGSQLTSGMNAIEAYYTNGKFDWSHSGGVNELHLFEGSGYGTGYLEMDCGYSGWDIQTRTFLDSFPDCNVIMWSWCGQVNSVNLQTHYLQPMSQLEQDYPDVNFIYMTGHLEGLGPSGSLFNANQEIRDFCNANNKILYDFADIEKFSPDNDTNYQAYFADDGCNYQLPSGGASNWAVNWLNNNPAHELTAISNLCGSCAHSISLNCIKKGIACWFLWARLAGWDGQTTGINRTLQDQIMLFPNPVGKVLYIQLPVSSKDFSISIFNLNAQKSYDRLFTEFTKSVNIDVSDFPPGIYVMVVKSRQGIVNQSFIKL